MKKISKSDYILERIINKMDEILIENPFVVHGVYKHDDKMKIYVNKVDETYHFSVIPKDGKIKNYILFNRGFNYYGNEYGGKDFIRVEIRNADTNDIIFRKLIYEDNIIYGSLDCISKKLEQCYMLNENDLNAYKALDEIFDL